MPSKNLMQNMMNTYFLDIPLFLKLIVSLIKGLLLLRNVVFNEIFKFKKNNFDDDFDFDTLNLNENSPLQSNLDASSSKVFLPKEWKYVDTHPKELIIEDISKGA